jgi:catechol 2,3-dioxygenase-like lactoylglutathione lyase family enzyme
MQPNGIHHIAVMTADMKKQIAFFSEVVGFPLVALFDMHGVPGGVHCFLKMRSGAYFSLVQLPGVSEIPATIGVTHAGTGAGVSARGTMQHVAFRVEDMAELLAMRDRIRSHGVPVLGPIEHGFCTSIYFAGPEDLTLEVSYAVYEIDPAQWIDPGCLAAMGISAEEAETYSAPLAYTGPGPVPQPIHDPAKPHLHYPEELYRKILAMPDRDVTGAGNWIKPPVEVPAE